MFIITISRQTASQGNKVAEQLSEKLGVELISRDYVIKNWLPQVSSKHELHMLKESPKFYKKESQQGITFAQYIENKLKEITEQKAVIIRGLGSQIIFKNSPTAIHIRIIASEEKRINRLHEEYGLQVEQAQRSLELSDRKHRKYVWKIYEEDWSKPELYHLCINMDGFTVNEAVNQIIYLQEQHKNKNEPLAQKITTQEDEDKTEGNNRVFAHSSEKEFARILDMHNIKWDFEPTEFPLEWDAEGNISLGFRPDFYLPEYDTYIELTTLKQQYVTEKNKKVRLLKKLYPEVNVNIVYKKDFNSIIERFGV